MYFYISFLRPPPLNASTSGTILITPQIANDLRTEPFSGAQDIYYSWSPSRESQDLEPPVRKPIKLTTWRQSSAYKEIPVPPPTGVRNGQSWRLTLSAQPHTHPHPTVELNDQGLGAVPLPVISAPILFSPGGSKKGKQEQIERVYTFASQQNDGPSCAPFRIMEQTSFDLDKVDTSIPILMFI